MEHYSNNQARTLFGDSVESNVVVAAALMLLTVLATEFVINFEVRKMRDRRRKRRNYIVNQRRRTSNYKERTENISNPKRAPSISVMTDDPYLAMSQSETRPFYIHPSPRRVVKKSDKIKLTLDEKELSKRLLSIYFNRLNKLIENN